MPGSIAPVLQGIWRQYKGQRYPANLGSPATDTAANGNLVMLEIQVDGQWMDITDDVMTRGQTPVAIRRGQSDQTPSINPGSCTFLLNNRSGKYSPRNAVGPLYGKIGRNTPIRVSVPLGNGKNYRFWGEVPAWPQNWDTTGRDVWVEVEAAGPLRRNNQSASAVRSTMYTALAAGTPDESIAPVYGFTPVPPIAYWSMEDGSTATQIAFTGTGDGQPMSISGTPTLANYSSLACSDPLPTMGSAAMTATVPSATNQHTWQIRFLAAFPAAGQLTDQSVLARIYSTAGSVGVIELIYRSGGGLQYKTYNPSGAVITDSGAVAFNVDGASFRVCIDTSGSTHTLTIVPVKVGGTATLIQATPGDIGIPRTVTLAPNRDQTNMVFGHLTVQNQTTSTSDIGAALQAFAGETADVRLWRLIAQAGYNFLLSGTYGDGVAMGPQSSGKLSDLIQECVDADGGFLFEQGGNLGLGYRTRASLYQTFGPNSYLVATLDYALGQFADVPKPVDDDRYTINDETITRKNGSSARSTVTTGTLNTQNVPLGVGPYQDSKTLNVQSDSTLADQASWRTWVGTFDAPRYPSVKVNLAHSSFTSGSGGATRSDVLNVTLGQRMGLKNLPTQTGAGPSDIVNVMVIGQNETIDQFQHVIDFVCAPHDPYLIAVADDSQYGHADTDGSTLAADLSPTQTNISLATTGFATGSPAWTTTASDFPFDLMAAGERMTMVCPGTCLNADPGMASIGNWKGQNATVAIDNTHRWVTTSTNSILVTPNGSSPVGGLLPVNSSGVGSITPNTTYTVFCWVKSPQGWSDVRAVIDWYDVNGTFLSTGLPSATVLAAGTWTFLTADLTAPASASQGYPRMRYANTPGSGIQFWVQNLAFTADSSVVTGASPQPYTVQRSSNGVVKAQAAGTAVQLAYGMVLGL